MAVFFQGTAWMLLAFREETASSNKLIDDRTLPVSTFIG
jgi:hypothetical protein